MGYRPGLPTGYVAGLPTPPRTLVMGVLNITPDSFSDGGLWLAPDAAVAHGVTLMEQGVDLIDVGGESTRPGAQRTSLEEESQRVLPVVRSLVQAGATVSVDTMRAEVAREAIEAGASMVNDVSGGLADERMLPLIAETGVGYVCMHWRGHSADMQSRAHYDDVVAEVLAELRTQLDAALEAGVQPDRLAIDPGLGFAKTAEHNWTLLGALDRLTALGYPVLIAASRKGFLGRLLADPETGEARSLDGRDDASAAISALAAFAGAWCVRVHAAPASLDAVQVAARFGADVAS